jgi:hypothetical protein
MVRKYHHTTFASETKVKQIPMKRILVLLIAALTLNVFGATTDDKTKGESTTSLPVKSITINGKVTDKLTGEALAGVAVKTDGSTTCYSDFDGNFSIQVNPEKLENLSAELISYSTSVVKVDINKTINPTLKIKIELEPIAE